MFRMCANLQGVILRPTASKKVLYRHQSDNNRQKLHCYIHLNVQTRLKAENLQYLHFVTAKECYQLRICSL
jgi:hypothetical protein